MRQSNSEKRIIYTVSAWGSANLMYASDMFFMQAMCVFMMVLSVILYHTTKD